MKHIITTNKITYFVEIESIGNNNYSLAFGVDGTEDRYCPVNSQFCNNVCVGCVHWDNGFKLLVLPKEQVEEMFEIIL
jgi:hypothetical protein